LFVTQFPPPFLQEATPGAVPVSSGLAAALHQHLVVEDLWDEDEEEEGGPRFDKEERLVRGGNVMVVMMVMTTMMMTMMMMMTMVCSGEIC